MDAKAPIVYVQPAQPQAQELMLCKKDITLTVTNLLTGQVTVAAVSDGTPCCYREDGKAYSSVYKGGACEKDLTLLCFKTVKPVMLAAQDPAQNRASGREQRQV